MQIKRVLFFALVTLAFASGCTRALPDDVQLSVSVPSNLSKLGTLGTAGSEKLELVILNLRETPTSPPRVFFFEAGKNLPGGSSVGSPLTLTIAGDAIPVSKTTLVQYAGVFKDDTGSLVFSYGDTTVNTAVNGSIPASIVATVYPSGGGRQLNFGGRYLTAANAGPTGGLTTYFQPPLPANATVPPPPMAVDRSEMIDGYFSTFAIEGGPTTNPKFTYKLQNYATNTESVIWADVNSSSSLFDPSDSSSNFIRLNMPPHFRQERRENGNILTKPDAGGWYYGGHWAVDSTVLASSNVGQYLDTAPSQTLNELNLDPLGATPLPYVSFTTTIPSLQPDLSSSDVATGTNSITVYPTRVRDHDSDVYGFRGVFAILDPSAQYDDAFLKATRLTATSVDLSWMYLPLSSGAISGAEVYYKFEQSGGGGNGGDGPGLDGRPNCASDLTKQGFVRYASGTGEVTGLTATISLTATPDGRTFAQDYGHRFAICPYKLVNSKREYYRAYASTSCFGGCRNDDTQMTFGNKVPGLSNDLFLYSMDQFDSYTVRGATARVKDVKDMSDGTFEIYFNSSTMSNMASIGDEIFVKVMGQKSSIMTNPPTSTCGNSGYGPIGSFEYDSAVVTARPDTGRMIIKPTRNDFLKGVQIRHNPTNQQYNNNFDQADLNAAPTASNFCYIQIVKVPHFGNVSFYNSSNGIKAREFNWDDDGGGIVAMRVNGTLDFSFPGVTIHANEKGFPSGSSPAGDNATYFSGAGGASTTIIGAGGAAGAGGSGGSGEGVGGAASLPGRGGLVSLMSPILQQRFTLAMGNGGGVGSAGTLGGRGGGLVMISARQIKVRGAGNSIDAQGAHAVAAAVGEAGSGGGGGGSVNIYAKNILNGDGATGKLTSSVSGGNGGYYPAAPGGGGGGAGFVKARFCDTSAQKEIDGIPQFQTNSTSAVLPYMINGGLKGGTGNAQFGMAGIVDNSDLLPMCKSYK